MDRRDPVVAQFVVQRILLTDFDKKQTQAFDDLTDRIIPVLREEGKKLEEQRKKLDAATRFAIDNVVERAGESVLQRIRDAIREKDAAIEKNMGEHLYQPKQKHDGILRDFKAQCDEMLRECEKFGETAKEFPKTLLYFYIGKCLFLGAAVYLAVEFFRT